MHARRMAARTGRSAALALLLATSLITPVAATGPTFALNVSWSGPVQVGDTITLTPVVGGVAPGTSIRCEMWIELDNVPDNFIRMHVASDACDAWTLTVPPSPSGTYVVVGRVYVGIGNDGNPLNAVLAPDQLLDIVDGGTPVAFSTNFPVLPWDIDSLISTPTPQFGEPFTVHAPPNVDGCALRFMGGFESATINEYDSCVDWTVSIPQGHQQAPASFFVTA